MKLDNIDITQLLEKYKNNKIVILGHDYADVDSIVSGVMLEHILKTDGFDVTFSILDKRISVESKELLAHYDFDPSDYIKEVKGDYYILVDHHERELDKDIILVVDHHPTSKMINSELVFNKEISSTALYLLMNNKEYFNKQSRELVFLATMLDTASFHSTKGREIDKEYIINDCNEFNIDYEKLVKEGIYLTNLDDLNKISLNGLKKYEYNGNKVESSYIQIDDNKDNQIIVNKIIDILKEYLISHNLSMFVFIVHEMINFKTRVYKITRNSVDTIYYDTYTSRGSTIMPSIQKEYDKTI